MPAPARKIDLRLNYPQYRHYGEIFDAQGEPYRNRLHFFPWGRGVGKTAYARFCWYLLVAKLDGVLRKSAMKPFRGVRINSLCPTLKQWKSINWAGIEQELGPRGDWSFLKAKLDRQSGEITFPGGSVIRPFPASDYNARTARGMRTDVLDAEEFDDIDSSVYDGVAIPWLSEPWSLGIQLLRGTPTRARHGLWYRTLQACKLAQGLRDGTVEDAEALAGDTAKSVLAVLAELSESDWPEGLPREPGQAALAILKNYYGWHATYRDAPETVSALAVAQAKADMPAATFEREWEANPDAGEGLIFPAFDEEFHVRPPPERSAFDELHAGMDFGDIHPTALLEGGVFGKGADRQLWIINEWYESEQPNLIWDNRVKALRHCRFWPDHSRSDRIRDFRSFGISVGDTDKNVAAGLARVADLLHVRQREHVGPGFQPIIEPYARLYIAPHCKNTIREFGLYRRKKLPDGSFSEEPDKKNDDAMDALRYMAMGVFGRLPNTRHIQSGS